MVQDSNIPTIPLALTLTIGFLSWSVSSIHESGQLSRREGNGGGGAIDLADTYHYVTVTPRDIINITNITCLPDEDLLSAFYSAIVTDDRQFSPCTVDMNILTADALIPLQNR